jgi:iron complex transport system ATP-binding protein
MTLAVENLCFAYGGTQVLKNVSFRAPAGKFTVLLGRNGSGKSTLLKVVAVILPPVSGTISVLGEDVTTLTGSARARLLGYLPQFHQTVFSFTVEDVVLTGRAAYVFSLPGEHDREHALSAIRRVGIEHLCHRPYSELSGGERQLVMIARVLAQQPQVILLDEPISHLDLANQQRLLGMLREITATGTTVVAVLHDPNAAVAYGDEVIFLKEGAVVSAPGDEASWTPSFIEDIYGVTTTVLPFRGKSYVIPIDVRNSITE